MAFDSAIVSFTTKTDKVDLVQAAHMNAVQAELVVIETILGTNVKGNRADLKTRLNNALDADGSILSGTSFPSPALTSQQFYRTDLNVLYIYTGSQWIAQSGLTAYEAGDYLIAGPGGWHANNLGAGTSFAKISEFYAPRSGTLRIKFRLAGTSSHGRIYRNGVAVGTDQTGAGEYSQDIAGWSAGDLVQLYAYNSSDGASRAGDLRIYESVPAREKPSSSYTPPLVRWGDTAPDNALGNQGDLYVTTNGAASTTLYVKTGASTWTAK